MLGLVAAPVAAGLGERPGSMVAAGLALAAIAGLLTLNRRLYGFFFAHGGFGFCAVAMALHVLYLLYSTAVFALMLAHFRLCGGKGGENDDARAVAPASRARKHLAGGIVFAALFAIYVGNGSPLPGNDATPNVHLAANLLARGTLVYTPEANPFFFRWTLVDGSNVQTLRIRSWDDRIGGRSARDLLRQGALRAPVAPYYLSRTGKPDAYVSSYGAATGLFALPFVAAVYPFVKNLPERHGLLWILSKLAAAFAVAASAWLLFLIASDHLRLSTAVLVTLAFGLGTCVWSVSSQALWQHAPGELFLALGMFCLFRRKRSYAQYLAGFAFGVAFLCRPTNSLAVLAGLLVLLSDRRAPLRYLAGGLPVAVAFLYYNLHYFDRWIAFGQVTALAERTKAGNTAALWQHSFFNGLAGVLVSPSRGLLVYSPIFVLSAWAALGVWKD